MSNFTHLHLHTHFSRLDGYGSPGKYIKLAKKLGFKSLAITDHGNIDGTFEFQKYCDKYGIKSVIGSELYLYSNPKNMKERFHIVLLCKNKTGWKNLCNLITKSNVDNFYFKPLINFKLLNKHSDGLICLTGCATSFLINLPENQAIRRFEELYNSFGADLYLEVQPHLIDKQVVLNKKCFELSDKYGVKIVPTNDCHYPEKDDAIIQEIMLAINSGKKWDDPKRWKFPIDGLYLKTKQEMIESFVEQGIFSNKQIESYINNIGEIVDKCNFRFEKQEISLPNVEIEGYKGFRPELILWNLCEDSLIRLFKLNELQLDDSEYIDYISNGEFVDYKSRFRYEFDLINSKGFSNYFLIVYDLLQYCKKEKIPVSPGRGSVAGSLIAYLLGITKLDPIEYELFFERFMSEDRFDFPDIDLDFASSKRHKVFKYLKDKYGDCVQIATFQKMHSRNAIKDVGRVFDIPYLDLDNMTKSIDKDKDIKTACKKTPTGRDFKKKYPGIVDYAIRLDGTIRGYGKHAGGLIITADNLKDTDKCAVVKSGDDFICSWSKDTCEFFGLVKFDILALTTLDIVDKCLELIEEDVDLDSIKPKSKRVIKEIFGKIKTSGIFQFDTWSANNMLKLVKPDIFHDLVCVNAMNRPGPKGAEVHYKFAERKRTGKWDRINKDYDEITKDTYGLIIFQEQVMKIINKLAGLSLVKSEKVRKIIAKSKGKKELEKYKDSFIQGCQDHSNLSEEVSKKIWKTMEDFGGYAFSLSHSTAYAYFAYQCAYLKYHYPAQWIIASLTFLSDEENKQKLLDEAVDLGLKVIPPKFGKSEAIEWKANDKNIYIPFNEVKGIGDETAKELIKNEKKKEVGFAFITSEIVDSKIDKILFDIGARREEIPDNIEKHLKSIKKINNNPYKNLHDLIGMKYFNADFDDILRGKLPPEIDIELIRKKQIQFRKFECNNCDLKKQAHQVVHPIVGEENIFIVDGDKIVEKELKKYGLRQQQFYHSKVCKCWLKGNLPNDEQIKVCSKYLFKELKRSDCRLVLAFGNIGLKSFLDIDSGIMKYSGKCQWVEKVNAWVVFCISPSSLSIDRKGNYPKFKKGIKKFVEIYRRFKGED